MIDVESSTMRCVILVFCLALLWGAAPTAAQSADEPIRAIYGADDRLAQTLDIYLPPNADGPLPVVLTIHGGGFFEGDLRTLSPLARTLVERSGAAVVNITYRLLPDHPYPAAVEDAFCALAWLDAEADRYGFDRERIFVLGESAGGYLATLLATVDDPKPYLDDCAYDEATRAPVRGAIIYYPLIDFTAPDFQPIGLALAAYWLGDVVRLGESFDAAAEHARALPLTALSAISNDDPPFLILHGERDSLVPPSQSELLVDALAAVDVPAELRLIPDADHGFAARVTRGPGAQAADTVLAFLQESTHEKVSRNRHRLHIL